MDVILTENVKGLGTIGEVVKVKPGYGRNFLVPQGLAVVASDRNITLYNKLAGSWPPLQLDRRRIGFAISALLDNAVKFTPQGGQITLAGEVGEHELRLSIRDTGIGISEEDLPKVFNKFYQVDPANTGQVRGFGLGLFYARQFIKDHGGDLTIESVLNRGTTVTIVLPRHLPA